MMILFLLIIGIAIYLLLKNSGSLALGGQTRGKSIDILKQRYVNGEINDEQYERMLKMIKD